MKGNFEKCLIHVLKSEGGYVNHPKDPGGETNLGVTHKVWKEWVKRELQPDEIKQLTIEKITPLYKAKYWDAIKGDDLPLGVDLCVFDCAVNSGVSRSVKFLQHSVGTIEDGIIGAQTLDAVKQQSPINLILDLCAQREMFLKNLSTFPTFGKGWMNRVDKVEEDAKKMANPSNPE